MAYLSILRVPGLLPVLIATIVSRYPTGFNALAIIFYVEAEQGSYAIAGAMVSAVAIGNTLGGPMQGRMVDRYGLWPITVCGLAHAAGLAAIILVCDGSVPVPAQLLVGLVTGAFLPMATSVLRSRWPYILVGRPELVKPAFALDSVMVELVFVTGPPIAGAALVLSGPVAAIVISATMAAIGSAAFAFFLGRQPGPERIEHRRGSMLGAFESPGVRLLAALSLPLGFYLGTLEIAIPAFAQEAGHEAFAGVMLAVLSIGSAVAALLYGTGSQRRSLWQVHMLFTFTLAVAAVPLAFMSSPFVAIPFVFLAGIPVATVIASRNELVRLVAPEGKEAESFTWPLTAMVLGISVGVAAGGALIGPYGWQAPILCAAVIGAITALAFICIRPSGAMLSEGFEVAPKQTWINE